MPVALAELLGPSIPWHEYVQRTSVFQNTLVRGRYDAGVPDALASIAWEVLAFHPESSLIVLDTHGALTRRLCSMWWTMCAHPELPPVATDIWAGRRFVGTVAKPPDNDRPSATQTEGGEAASDARFSFDLLRMRGPCEGVLHRLDAAWEVLQALSPLLRTDVFPLKAIVALLVHKGRTLGDLDALLDPDDPAALKRLLAEGRRNPLLSSHVRFLDAFLNDRDAFLASVRSLREHLPWDIIAAHFCDDAIDPYDIFARRGALIIDIHWPDHEKTTALLFALLVVARQCSDFRNWTSPRGWVSTPHGLIVADGIEGIDRRDLAFNCLSRSVQLQTAFTLSVTEPLSDAGPERDPWRFGSLRTIRFTPTSQEQAADMASHCMVDIRLRTGEDVPTDLVSDAMTQLEDGHALIDGSGAPPAIVSFNGPRIS